MATEARSLNSNVPDARPDQRTQRQRLAVKWERISAHETLYPFVTGHICLGFIWEDGVMAASPRCPAALTVMPPGSTPGPSCSRKTALASQNGTSAACAMTLTWKDSSGHDRKITMAPGTGTSFATSLPNNGKISWSLASGSGLVIVVWQVEPR